LRHKDAFKIDSNNLKCGQKLRKITLITYLNPQIDTSSTNQGELRLYLPDKILDVVPHLGRTIVFKSEVVEHEVRPTLGYERFAVTTWFH
jgi:SM-20-related protein